MLPFVQLYVETKSGHAGLVLGDQVLAGFLGIVAVGEEHTLVAGGLFILADAAWFRLCGGGGGRARRLEVCAEVTGGCGCGLH